MRCFRDMHDRRPSSRAVCVLLLLMMPSCGSNPGGPTPSPSPSPTAQPGGTVAGPYTLQIVPSASCAMPRTPQTFPMAAAAAGTSPHPGVQVLLDPNGLRLEMETLSTTVTLRGGVGTRADGAFSDQGMRVWVRVIAAGPVQHATDGRGEIVSGVLAGYMALASGAGAEGELGTCLATDHAFTLRTR
jgi:hypothetical protein